MRSMLKGTARFITLSLVLPIVCSAQDGPSSDEPLIHRLGEKVGLFSIPSVLRQLKVDEARLKAELDVHPLLQDPLRMDAYGYHGGYLPALDALPTEPRWTVDVQFANNTLLQKVILVPAIDQRLDQVRSFGFPRRFRVLAVYPDGHTVVAAEWMDHDYADPGRIPLIVDMPRPGADCVRVEVFRGEQTGEKEYFAMDEIFGLAKSEDARANAPGSIWFAKGVDASSSFESKPYWSKAYLIDQKTSLGLPQRSVDGTLRPPDTGDFSVVFDQPPGKCEIFCYLGNRNNLGWITMFPARPPEGILIPGYGFPRKISIEILDNGKSRKLPDLSLPDGPGNNQVRIPCYSRLGSIVHLTFSDLPIHNEKSIFAMGEIVFSAGENLREIQRIRLEGFPPGADKKASRLIDGFAGGKQTMLIMDWLYAIEKRDQIEKRLAVQAAWAESLHRRWIDAGIRAGVSAGAFTLSATFLLGGFLWLRRRRHENRLRQRITQDLHDDIGSRLSAMSLASNYLEKVSEDPEMRDGCRELDHLAREAQAALSDVLWFTNSSTDSLNQLVGRLIEVAFNGVPRALLRIETSPVEQVPEKVVGVMFKRDLLFLFKEMVNNAVKHSGASTIDVRVVWDGSRLSLCVADNGKGFNVDETRSRQYTRPHLGLNGMDRRAKRLGGTFNIDSMPGHGCRISIIVKP